MDFICYADKNYEVKVRAEGSMNCVYWHANGDWITEFMQKLTVAQQAQILLGDDVDPKPASKKKDAGKIEETPNSEDEDELKRIEGLVAEYMNQQMQLEQKLQEKEEAEQNLQSQLNDMKMALHKMEEERNLLLKLKEAFVDGREQTELNLLKATEELAAEKLSLSDQFEASRMHYEKQTEQLECALEVENRKLEDKEKDHRSEVEDLFEQIEALQKQLSSNSKFTAEQTSEREQERDQFQQELARLQEELDKKHELFRSDSKLAHEVARLEEEMDARDQAHLEEIATMQEEENKMKKTIKEYEENIQELRSKDQSEQLDKAQTDLQEVTRERDVLQQELYDNLLKVSALEARLDTYKHSADLSGPNGGAGDQSQMERLRMNLDQEREAHETKDNEIEHLVGVHSQLRSEIVEKEEEIERLLLEIEHYKVLEAENIELKGKLTKKQKTEQPATSSRAEELSALSQQLLNEKNMEIDDLQNQITQLEKEVEKTKESPTDQKEKQNVGSEELRNENCQLKLQLEEAIQKLESKDTLQKLELEVSGHEEDLDAEAERTSHDVLVCSLHETLEEVRRENESLKAELERRIGESQQHHGADAGSIPSETKEKIRHLQELLEKEKDSTDSEHDNKLEVGTALASSSKTDDNSDDIEEPNIINEKLQEIEEDLKNQPGNILGMILAEKDKAIAEKESVVQQLEHDAAAQNQSISRLQEEVSSLEHDLKEPDVKIRMRKRSKSHPGKGSVSEEIDIEKDESSSDGDSSKSSNDGESSASEQEQAIAGAASIQQEDPNELSPDELKILLDQQEKDLQMKDEMIENQAKILSGKEKEYEDMKNHLKEMVDKCEELQNEVFERLEEVQQQQEMPEFSQMNEEQILHLPVVMATISNTTEDLEKSLKASEQEAVTLKEEKDRLKSDLTDVQREYMALLGDSREVQEMQEKQDILQEKIRDLEDLVEERESELQQAQREAEEAQSYMQELKEQIEYLQQQEQGDVKGELLQENQKELADRTKEVAVLHQEIQHQNEIVAELEGQLDDTKIKSEAYKEEIELLQNEQQILNAENERIQQETDDIRNKMKDLEELVTTKQKEVEMKEKELEVLNQERFIEPRSAMLLDEGSLEDEDVQGSSLDDVDAPTSENVMKMHQATMDEMKENYSHEIERAVEETRKRLDEEYEAKMQEMKDQHEREVENILSDSGESELARKLRDELDHAEQLDENLIGHLTRSSVDSAGPDTSDISSRLQNLLERVHNEGVQVLSLSELQLIKYLHDQHQQKPQSTSSTPTPTTVEEAQQTSMRLEEDLNHLRQSWESEKLALLNAIQALKELVAQTNADNSNEQLPESDDWRGDLLQSVSDVFEREREALLAELQTTVAEVQQSMKQETGQDKDTMTKAVDRLAELEKKLKQQGAQHTSALERLLSADRDSLLSEIKDLKDDRKTRVKQAEGRVQQLESLLNSNDNASLQNIHLLKSQVERLEFKLQQERALAADARNSLESERIRTSEHLPVLQRERERSEQLENEVTRLQRKLADDAQATRTATENLQCELDDNRHHLEDLRKRLAEAESKLREAEDVACQEKRTNDRVKAEDAKVVADLKRALKAEENRRDGLVRSLEDERANVARLHDELANLHADSRQEIAEHKMRTSEVEDSLAAEKRRCDDLNSALRIEQESNGRLRQTLEEERDAAKEARQNDRATVADLQKILDDARRETERLQKKIDNTTREANMARQQLEETRAVHSDSIEAERALREQIHSTLDDVKNQKQETQRKLQDAEDELRRLKITSYATNAGVPASSETAEGLLAHRRQLESLRQRLQLESTKLQDLTSKASHRIPLTLPSEGLTYPQEAARELASEIEQVDSVKRSLAEMQQELRELYVALTMPTRDRLGVLADPTSFNDRLLEQNAEVVMMNTRQADEKMTLRERLRKLEEELWKAKADTEDHQVQGDNKQHKQQVQEMASRMHRLYTRYLRAESFRKALVYQKKYLLLLIGGFQDCEEATLAVIARMGAYPRRDSFDRPIHRSAAFKKFRSAVRAVIAISRLKFLVRKFHRTSHSVSASIQEKHGAAPMLNGHHHHHHHAHQRPSPAVSPSCLRPTSSTSAHTLGERSPSPTPLPRYRHGVQDSVPPYEPYKSPLWANTRADPSPSKLTKPPMGPSASTYGLSGVRRRSADTHARAGTSPYLTSYGDQPSATALRYLNGVDRSPTRPRPHSSYYPDQRSGDLSSLTYSRTQPGESDPSLNEYIQKLENLHHRLEQNPHRYQR